MPITGGQWGSEEPLDLIPRRSDRSIYPRSESRSLVTAASPAASGEGDERAARNECEEYNYFAGAVSPLGAVCSLTSVFPRDPRRGVSLRETGLNPNEFGVFP